MEEVNGKIILKDMFFESEDDLPSSKEWVDLGLPRTWIIMNEIPLLNIKVYSDHAFGDIMIEKDGEQKIGRHMTSIKDKTGKMYVAVTESYAGFMKPYHVYMDLN